ncbi:alpha/beta hydrolase-fold protein [Paraglaciecola aquimarina]|uniref:Alpha/beta hydrolase-fold protein n=1 Tax=Paraglaciecola aquimarina TaxID=1235557 RepID=A0ABU3SSA8_9ALTE|nr:alpha/beta hydrolase-fold protein [Paraglaciecola aquimarina]MDU0352863.1 alpha/beta hydrolase-fold protein [Paraglaciecola aquimarina]
MFSKVCKYLLGLMVLFCMVLKLSLAHTESIPWDKLQGLGKVEYFSITNPRKTKSTLPYHIFVRVPEEYDKSKSQQFAVLYLLDGGTNFPLFAAHYTHLRWMKDLPPMIIVGISYGTHDWRKGNDRSHDFTAPSKEREHWGGAAVFEQFIGSTLMPRIQQKYPVDKNQQFLFGHSLGGQFALYSSMYGQAPFAGVIASNPALYRNVDYFRRPLPPNKNRPRAFVSIAELDDDKYKIPATEWVTFWQEQPVQWQYKFVTIDNQNHLSANPDVIRNGLMWLLQK